MKYVNKFNRGVAKVQEILKENGNLPAKFDVDTLTAFRVVVNATAEDTSEADNDKNGGVNGDVNGDVKNLLKSLSLKTQQVYALIKENNNLTYKELSSKLDIPYRTIEKHIKKLRDLNIIRREGSDKTGKWIILIPDR